LWSATDGKGNSLYSLNQIGKKLGFSKNSICGKAHRLNLPCRPSPIVYSEKPRSVKPTRIRQIATLPPLTCAPVVPQKPVPLLLRSASCMWPSGERPIRFECRDNALPNYSYCEAHCAVAFVNFRIASSII
jgi:GcrA cell cycle regulator